MKRIFLVLIMLSLTLIATGGASAASQYYIRYFDTGTTAFTCATNSLARTDRGYEYNLPTTGGEQHDYITVEDASQLIVILDFTASRSGTNSTVQSGTSSYPAMSYPYTYTHVATTYVNGVAVWRNTQTVVCDANGAAASFTFVDEDLTTVAPAGGTTTPTTSAPVPGPDMVAMPAWSVVGTFNAAAPLHYAPENGAATDWVMQTGQTLWVTGMDASGQYYQVVLSGDFLWAPVDVLGPTFDDVWNGTPLPVEVVD